MNLLVERRHRVLHLTLNRPEKRNALTAEMCGQIATVIGAAQEDEHVGSILITAVGQVFCSGMDLDEAVSPAGLEISEVHEKLFTIGAESLKPIVIAVNGAALGGGLGLVAQGHVVLAATGAVFGLPEIRIGLWPFLVYRSVEAALGARRTLELSLTGRVFPAEDAFQWGIAHRVCPPAEVCDRAKGVARDLAKSCPTAISAGMLYARESRGKSSSQAGRLARSLRDKLMQSADFIEGCAAFKEKRDPQWPSMP
jgi:enoyl-CoA hydratase/carnithine racemase